MDQRYDPAFQRGHADGRARSNVADTGRRSRLASLEEVAPQLIQPPTDGRPVRPPTDDRFDDGPRGRIEPLRAGTPTDSTTPVAGPSPDDLARWADEDEEARAAHLGRARAWERALWIVGVVFTLGGGVGLWQSFTLLYRGFVGDSGPTDNYLWMQFLGALAPSLIMIGLATIVALLFKRMLDHDRRSRP